MFDNILIPFERGTATRPITRDEMNYVDRMEYEPFFFTFGSGQAFPNGVVCIWASDRDEARAKMHNLFGSRWSFDYDLESMADYVSRWRPYLVGEYVVD